MKEFPHNQPSDEREQLPNASNTIINELREGAETWPPPIYEVRSKYFADNELMNYNDDILALLREIATGHQVLDIFAGTNKTREFYEREGVETSVTTVDITPGRADIAIDVAQIAEVIPPQKQFHLVLAFGAHPGYTKYDVIRDLLDDDGYFVTGGSDEMFQAHDLPFISNRQVTADGPYDKELERIAREFHPVMVVKVRGIHGWYKDVLKNDKNPEGTENSTYVVWRKGEMVTEKTSHGSAENRKSE